MPQASSMRTTGFFDLSGRNALVVGGGRGIGYAIAERFFDAGANVCIVCQSKTSCDQAIAAFATTGRRVIGSAAEASDYQAVCRAYEEGKRLFGEIDVLVITVGIVGPTMPIWD